LTIHATAPRPVSASSVSVASSGVAAMVLRAYLRVMSIRSTLSPGWGCMYLLRASLTSRSP
jgi:hypothetical protein